MKDGQVRDAFVEKNKGQKVKGAADLLRKQGLLSKKVKLSLKGPDTLIRYVPFPKVEKTKLREVFSYEISKYLPFPQGAVYFDIFILDENYSKEEFLILLAAAKKKYVDSLLREFQEEKTKVGEITLSNIALVNLFFYSEKASLNAAIVDFGSSSTLLSLVKKDRPYLSREIKVGAANFIEKLSAVKNLGIEETEDWLINSSKEEDILPAVEELFFDLCEEIRNSLDYFEMNAGGRIEKIYLTGGFSRIKGIEKIIKISLDVDTIIWENKSRLKFDDNKNISFTPQMMSVVSGLSL